MQCGGSALCGAVALQIQPDQLIAGQQEKHGGKKCDSGDDPYFKADGLPDSFLVFLSEILCRENTRSGYAAEQAQIVDKDQLVNDGDTRHRLRADPADHNVVQKTYKIRNTVLYHDRNGNGQYHFIKCLIADKSAQKAGLCGCPGSWICLCDSHDEVNPFY